MSDYTPERLAAVANGKRYAPVLAFANEIIEAAKAWEADAGRVLRLQCLCLDVRDAVNKYHRTKEQNALDELERLVAQCNTPDLIELPEPIKQRLDTIEAENAALRHERRESRMRSAVEDEGHEFVFSESDMFAGHNKKRVIERPERPIPPRVCNSCGRERVGDEPWYFFADGTQSCEPCAAGGKHE